MYFSGANLDSGDYYVYTTVRHCKTVTIVVLNICLIPGTTSVRADADRDVRPRTTVASAAMDAQPRRTSQGHIMELHTFEFRQSRTIHAMTAADFL